MNTTPASIPTAFAPTRRSTTGLWAALANQVTADSQRDQFPSVSDQSARTVMNWSQSMAA